MDLLCGGAGLAALIDHGEADIVRARIPEGMLDDLTAGAYAIAKIPSPGDDWNLPS
jgi:hypothetical protein